MVEQMIIKISKGESLLRRVWNYITQPSKLRGLSEIHMVPTAPDVIDKCSTLIGADISGGRDYVVVWKYADDSYFWRPDIIEFHNWKGAVSLFASMSKLHPTILERVPNVEN